MFGFVNHAIELLVTRNFGDETWEKIKETAKLDLDGQFILRNVYDDSISYDLVGAASQVLGLPASAILELFGALFFDFCQESGYGNILHVLGSNIRDFLQNLDALHDHLQTIYPGMKAPSFTCTEAEDGATILHYYSDRPGLEHIVIGLVRKVAEKVHDTTVDCQIFKTQADGIDHIQFKIIDKGDATTNNASEKQACIPTLTEEPKISPDSFSRIFPFHLVFGPDFKIIQAGRSIVRMIPAIEDNPNVTLTDLFELARPHMDFTYNNVLLHLNTVYVMNTLPGVLKSVDANIKLRFKGEMIYVEESNAILFIGSPNITNLDEMYRKGLRLSDIPLHDATRDLVLMSEHFEAEYKLTKELEILTDQLQNTYQQVEEEKEKTDRLMYSVLPAIVANELRASRPVPPKKYRTVTVLFSGIVGFSDFCVRHSDQEGALKIVTFLNDTCSKIDELIAAEKNANLYKVETVGDQYMCVSGLPTECSEHARLIARFALDMMDTAKEVKDPEGNPVKFRIGIHSGEVVTGVIGQRVPRYCLFGNTVNLASRTETTGISGKINVSGDAHRYLCEEDNFHSSFDFKFRGPVEMKGKSEPMQCWLLSRKTKKSKSCSII